jgi:MSHA biogenesis protein MshO
MDNVRQQQGFSLIELVIVIILLAVVAVSMTTLFRDTTENYLQSERRHGMAASGRLALERIGREIREALPNSVRVSNNNDCVEFVPIVAASQYTQLPTTAPGTAITVVEADSRTEISGLNTTGLYAMVIPLNTNEVYNTASGHQAPVTGFSKLGGNLTEVTIGATRFNRKSPQNRIFFVQQPVSFCVVGNRLLRYTNYGFNTTQPTPAAMGSGDLILNRVLSVVAGAPVDVFTYQPGTLNRSAILVIELHLEGRKESINFEHEVHVRNFP